MVYIPRSCQFGLVHTLLRDINAIFPFPLDNLCFLNKYPQTRKKCILIKIPLKDGNKPIITESSKTGKLKDDCIISL